MAEGEYEPAGAIGPDLRAPRSGCSETPRPSLARPLCVGPGRLFLLNMMPGAVEHGVGHDQRFRADRSDAAWSLLASHAPAEGSAERASFCWADKLADRLAEREGEGFQQPERPNSHLLRLRC